MNDQISEKISEALNGVDWGGGAKVPRRFLQLQIDNEGDLKASVGTASGTGADKLFISHEHDSGLTSPYFGTCSVSGLNNILPLEDRDIDTDGAEFHTKHGIFVRLTKYSYYLPFNCGDLYIHLYQTGGTWNSRLVRSLPSNASEAGGDFPVTKLISTFVNKLTEGADGILAKNDSIADRDIGNFPQWCDSLETWQESSSGKLPPFKLELTGAVLSINYEDAPLRIQPSRISATSDGETYQLEFTEQSSLSDRRDIQYKWLTLGQQTVSPTDWTFAAGIVAPLDSSTSLTDQSSQKAVWINGINDEWLRIGFSEYASDDIVGETRRWRFGKLLTAFPKSANLALSVDNSGTKVLKAKFSGETREVTLGLERPAIELRIGRDAAVHPQSPLDALPRLGSSDEAQGREITLTTQRGLNETPVKFSISIDGGLTLEGTEASKMIHWLRPESGLISPVKWSRHDSQALNGVSTFRGLIPLQCESGFQVTFKKEKQALIERLDKDKKYEFPAFALGEKLLVASADSGTARIELEIAKSDILNVYSRYALPHLDPFYSQKKTTDAPDDRFVVGDESFTWVKDRRRKWSETKTYETITPSELLAKIGLQAPNGNVEAPLTGKKIDGPITYTATNGKAVFKALWYPDVCRWTAVAGDNLRTALGSNTALRGLTAEILGLRVENGALAAVDFSIVPTHGVRAARNSRLTWIRDKSNFEGSLFLTQENLSNTHQENNPIKWYRTTDDGKDSDVKFLGLESGNVSLIRSKLALSDLRYWFALDGIDFSVQTQDILEFVKGKWNLKGDTMKISSPPDDTPGPRIATFTKISKIAPGISIEEILLGAAAPKLVLKYGTKKLTFELKSSYHAQEDAVESVEIQEDRAALVERETSQKPIALLRPGAYHLAWAGELDGEDGNDITGLMLGSLNRLFLRLKRSKDGSLVATGMIGWNCTSLTVGGKKYVSENARATIYAHEPDAYLEPGSGDDAPKWSLLRISGEWTYFGELANATTTPTQIGLPRVDLPLVKSAAASWQIDDDAEWAPVLVKYAAKYAENEKTAFCYQSLAIRDGFAGLKGDVRFATHRLNYSKEFTQEIPTFSTRWVDPLELQNNLSPTSEPWSAIEANLEDSPLDWMSSTSWNSQKMLKLFQGTGLVGELPVGIRKVVGLSKRSDNGWLLCPVTDLSSNKIVRNKKPKLWLIHSSGEDLIELPGFEEITGGDNPESVGAPVDENKPRKSLGKYAEDMLSLLRWREPAVLEHWPDDKPVWTIVDAPLLNPFSTLEFMNGKPSKYRSVQRQPGFVDSTDLPIPFEGNPPSDYSNVTLYTREIPFEKGPEAAIDPCKNVWLADASPWPHVMSDTGQQVHDGAETESNPWNKTATELSWRVATPRPGELVDFVAEQRWSPVDGKSGPLTLGPMSRYSGRSKTGGSAASSGKFTIGNQTILWPIGPKQPADESDTDLLIRAPKAKTLRIGESFPIGVAIPDEQEFVLRFSMPVEFQLEIETIGIAVSKEGTDGKSHEIVVVFPSKSHGQVFAATLQTSNEAVATGTLFVHARISTNKDAAAGFVSEPPSEGSPSRTLDISPRESDGGSSTPEWMIALLDNNHRVIGYGSGANLFQLAYKDDQFQWTPCGAISLDKKHLTKDLTVLQFRRDGSISEISAS